MIQPVCAGFALQADVVEAARVPQRHEVAMQRLFVVVVTLFGEDQCAQRILRNASGPSEIDSLDDILRRDGGSGFRGIRRRLWCFQLRLGRSGSGSRGLLSCRHRLKRVL